MFKKAIIVLILLLLIIPVSVLADDENHVKNPGFEDVASGYPEDWFEEMWHTASDYTVIEVVPFGDTNVLKIANEYENDARLAQNVKVRGNRTYKLSGYIMTEGVLDGQGANLSFEDIMATTDGVFDTQGQWQYVEIYGRTSLFQSGIKIFVRVGGYGNLSTGTAYFDNIRFEEIKDVPDGTVVHSLKKPKPPKVEKEGIQFLAPSILITLFMLFGFLMLKNKLYEKNIIEKKTDYKTTLWLIIGIGVIIRIILAMSIRGYPNDISCWLGWCNATASSGLFGVYELDIFIDYPPGYMYILYPLGLLMKLMGTVPERLSWLIVKIPPITSDILLSLIIFKVAYKKLGKNKALILTGIYFLNPAVILNSSAWGQIDGVLALFVILYTIALYDRKFMKAGIFLAIGVLLKVQMVLFAPLYLTALWSYFRERKTNKEFTLKALSGVGAGLLTLIILALPFFYKSPMDFFKLYTGALETYSTVSLNAANLWALLGGMWKPVTSTFLGVEYSILTNIGLVIAIVTFFVIGFLDRKKEHIFMHAALLITGIFMLSGKMHERYMFTAIALLIMSFVFTERKSSYILLMIFSATQFMNTALVLANDYIYGNNIWTVVMSVAAVLGYAYMVYVAIDMYRNKTVTLGVGKPKVQAKTIAKKPVKEPFKLVGEEGFFKKFTRIDTLLILCLTVVYAVVAFINLGTTVGPETNFELKSREQVVIVDFGEPVQISQMWYFRGKATSGANFNISYSNDLGGEYQTLNYIEISHGGRYTSEEEIAARDEIKLKYDIPEEIAYQIVYSNYPDLLKWFKNDAQITARYAKVKLEKPMIYLFEIGFKDQNKNVIPIKEIIPVEVAENTLYTLLFDEQDTIPESVTYMNGTYFDEIYHAGTAWEHINYVNPYETTHPPLGKVIMSWGMKIFGTNTFGWRFMGTLFGVLMVPVMYLLAKMLLKKSLYAFIATFLFTFDFMHFTQTRIATIDTYGVFFIMLMYLFMGIYYQMSYNKTPLLKTLIPLGASGIAFGLGAASKWICIYAGIGLAVLLFMNLYRRWREYEYCKKDGTGISDKLRDEIVKNYVKKTLITLGWCVVFFIIIPIAIYIMSYIPIMKIGPSKDLSYVWRNQVNMFNYHSALTASHPYASPWYEWPFLVKPMWYYSNDALRSVGKMSSIAAFGNPAVWWTGTIAMIYLFIDTYLKKKPSKVAIFVIIGFLSQYLPWVLVTRSMFIYHYFAAVPFFIIAIVMAIKKLYEKKKINMVAILIYLGIVLALFIFFYPVLSGAPISSAYGRMLKWLPTWWFTY
ncbi:MAG: phospholipid carrier-dependent glycosyltransferase [Clostridiales bacterium]|nr:phospholipid carrier-dependent glycosyltransferase [Clostridiales bacterium]